MLEKMFKAMVETRSLHFLNLGGFKDLSNSTLLRLVVNSSTFRLVKDICLLAKSIRSGSFYPVASMYRL